MATTPREDAMAQDEAALLREISAENRARSEAYQAAQARRRRLAQIKAATLVIAGGLIIAAGYALTALLVHWRMGG